MANLFIERVDGTLLLEDITWSDRSSESNNITESTTFVGKGQAFLIRPQLTALKNIQTKWGSYKSHSIQEGGGEYDRISVTFHRLIKTPTYIYDFSGPTKAFPLESHPNYKTYWNNNIVSTNNSEITIDAVELDAWQEIEKNILPSSPTANLGWEKWSQASSAKNNIALLDPDPGETVSGWNRCEASKKGQNSYIYPTITVRETIYFKEPVKFNVSFVTFTGKGVEAGRVAAMDGRAGWPKTSPGRFGYPQTVGDLFSGNYDEYKKIGVDKEGADIVITSTFFTDRGIPNSYPLWICTSCNLKKIGYWYEATLMWQYGNYGVDPELYPLATARTNGLI